MGVFPSLASEGQAMPNKVRGSAGKLDYRDARMAEFKLNLSQTTDNDRIVVEQQKLSNSNLDELEAAKLA